MGSATLLGREKEIGSLELGKKSDFIIIDKNIYSMSPYFIHKAKVISTCVSGRMLSCV